MHENQGLIPAPPLSVAEWCNTDVPLDLERLGDRPVLIHAFQMLCPGCVAHSIPQAQKVQTIFAKTDLHVIGLHTVFEHHDAMTHTALKAFLHEYRIDFPVGIDTPSATGAIPKTMAAYGMRGTPTTILINRNGNIVANLFGQIEDLALGAMLQDLTQGSNNTAEVSDANAQEQVGGDCDEQGCRLPA